MLGIQFGSNKKLMKGRRAAECNCERMGEQIGRGIREENMMAFSDF